MLAQQGNPIGFPLACRPSRQPESKLDSGPARYTEPLLGSVGSTWPTALDRVNGLSGRVNGLVQVGFLLVGPAHSL